MYSYIKQFDQYSYEIAPKGFPYDSNIEIYEGDEISITLRGINLDQNKDPYNFDQYDSFSACFSVGPESETYCASDSNFVLGQSQDAINYDQNQGNPAGTTKDELHFIDADYSILSEYPFYQAILDIQGKLNDSIYTFMRFDVNIKQEITK
jgi:hypothetical protein